ncbi:MAG: hypothetical protein HUJ76_03745, partial [Parasporobacterium sp.]|nr:hypothetical protein [Parasporobacterium sp.]
MKKLTPFLAGLLAMLLGMMILFKYLGVTEPARFDRSYVTHNVLSPEQHEDSPEQPAADPSVPVQDDTGESILPGYYNSMKEGRINRTRDQGELGACWAFAANAALESRLMPDEVWDFSEDHMIWNCGFENDLYSGGDSFMAVAYLSAWKGPVIEEDDPYNDGATNTDAKAVKHLQEAVMLDNPEIDEMKQLIREYGAIESSMYMAVNADQYI